MVNKAGLYSASQLGLPSLLSSFLVTVPLIPPMLRWLDYVECSYPTRPRCCPFSAVVHPICSTLPPQMHPSVGVFSLHTSHKP